MLASYGPGASTTSKRSSPGRCPLTYVAVPEALKRWPGLPNLRVFQMGWPVDEDYGDRCHFRCYQGGHHLPEVIARMARLEEAVRGATHDPIGANEVLSYIGNVMASRISSSRNLVGPSFTMASDATSGPRALEVAELLLDRCGLPSGWLHVVTGPGRPTGVALVDHEDVAMITFTGSPEVGWGIRATAARKKVSLELVNNSPVIVHADGDGEAAAAAIARAGYAHAGQLCVSVQRVLVHRRIAGAFTEALVAAVDRLVVGDPTDEATDVSAVIDEASRDRVLAWIQEAVDAGAGVAAGGKVTEAGVLLPTVLVDVTPDLRVCRDEVFGPVVAVQVYDDLDEAFALANDTRYGLHAGLYTADLGLARRAMQELEFGGVIVNDVPTWRADHMPYGGVRDSGNTREGPLYTYREMTDVRSVVLA